MESKVEPRVWFLQFDLPCSCVNTVKAKQFPNWTLDSWTTFNSLVEDSFNFLRLNLLFLKPPSFLLPFSVAPFFAAFSLLASSLACLYSPVLIFPSFMHSVEPRASSAYLASLTKLYSSPKTLLFLIISLLWWRRDGCFPYSKGFQGLLGKGIV